MSGSVGLSTAPFTDAEKADIRRFCGYPTYGQGASGFQGWRFFTAYGLLEYRMNNLAPAEYQNVRFWLAQIYPLETGVLTAVTNIGTDRAAVWTRNRTEFEDRTRVYNYARRRLCDMLGVPPGPDLGEGGFVRVI